MTWSKYFATLVVAGQLFLCQSLYAAAAAGGLVEDLSFFSSFDGELSFDPPDFTHNFGGISRTPGAVTPLGNYMLVNTLVSGTGADGTGFSVSVSNGENGDGQFTNEVEADPAFATIGNTSGRLENGNVIRWSAWVQQDPNDPISIETQIEPILKLEFWRVALSSANTTDRILDTEIDLGLASHIDMNNDGDIAGGQPVDLSLAPTSSEAEWQLVEYLYTVDENDFNQAGGSLADVEEVRGAMFFGSFDGRDLTQGGSLWWDNALIEVFPDFGSVTPNENPFPAYSNFNRDNVVDLADYVIWRNRLGTTGFIFPRTIGDANFDGVVNAEDYEVWKSQFGAGTLGSVGVSNLSQVPEPSTAIASFVTFVALLVSRRSVG